MLIKSAIKKRKLKIKDDDEALLRNRVESLIYKTIEILNFDDTSLSKVNFNSA